MKHKEKDYISFGRYKYVPIIDVPFEYLEWFINNISSQKYPEDYEIVENEYIRRKNNS
jgi:uncharacterized protein (DUF3820 family)